MTENERVKLVRNHFGLTMDAFGERVGLKKSAISLMESGRSSVSNSLRRAVCREFKVSEQWLLDGIGGDDIVFEQAEDAAALFARDNHLDTVEEVLIREYLKLDDKSKEMFRTYLRNVLTELQPAQAPTAADQKEKEIDQKVNDYRAELEAEAASNKSEASQTGSEDIVDEA